MGYRLVGPDGMPTPVAEDARPRMEPANAGLAQVWPLVGRENELRAVMAAMTSPPRGGVVLVGDAGVGKTRLAREAIARWTGMGGDTDWVTGTRGAASIPFGAVSRLLPPGLADTDSPLALLGAVAQRFAERSVTGPVIVGVDDAHLLDEGSAAILHQLAVRGLVMPVASVRAGEPVGDALTALWKEGILRLSLDPLPAAAVDELLRHALGGQIDAISRRRLGQLADGNPLLLRELLADALETGALRMADGVWRWHGRVPLDARLAELVAARLHGLDASVRHVLEIIACGEPLALSLVQRMADVETVAAAERSGMAIADRSGGRVALRLAHPLYGEVLRAGLPVSRAHVIWGRLAVAVADTPMRRRDDALTAGVWQLEAGTISHPAVLLAGARRSIALFDLDLAERLVRAARGAGHGWEADWLLARVLQLRGRSAEAVDVLPGPPADGGVPFAMWAVTRASLVYWGLGEAAEAERILTSARPGSEPGTEKTGSDLTESIRSWIILYDGRCRAALDVAEAVLARPDGSAQSVVWATMAASSAAGLLGELARAERITDDGDPVAVAHADDLPWGVVQVRYGLCLALIATGQVRRARTLADEGYRSALAVGARPMTGLWAGFQGLAAKASGRLMDAQTNLRDALALLEGDDSYQMSRVCLAELAGALALTGEVAAARRFLDRADALAMGCNRLLDAWVVRNQAWVRAAEGNIDAAVRLASRAAELANDTQQPTTEALCLYDVARLGAAAQVYERIGLLATRVEGGFVTMLAVAAKALAIGDPEALELAATALVDQGQLLLAAEAAAAAARGYRQADQPDRAVALGERAAVLTGRCQGARTPLLALDGVHTVLTAREREIALLATTQSSRQIADHLDLSVHTVNNTLGRAFVKLGVTNRGELADLLIAPPR